MVKEFSGAFPPSQVSLPLYNTAMYAVLSSVIRSFLQSKLTAEPNSGSFWIDGAVVSAFYEEPPCLFERAATPLELPRPSTLTFSCHPSVAITSTLFPPPPEMPNA